MGRDICKGEKTDATHIPPPRPDLCFPSIPPRTNLQKTRRKAVSTSRPFLYGYSSFLSQRNLAGTDHMPVGIDLDLVFSAGNPRPVIEETYIQIIVLVIYRTHRRIGDRTAFEIEQRVATVHQRIAVGADDLRPAWRVRCLPAPDRPGAVPRGSHATLRGRTY